MRFNLPIPKTDDDFEHLCCELLKRVWALPHLQRYGHRGDKQDGVDIFDPVQTRPVRGGQCKLHGYGKTIPSGEVEAEVKKVRRHRPAVDHFTILTTARKLTQADRKISEINRDHQAKGLFTARRATRPSGGWWSRTAPRRLSSKSSPRAPASAACWGCGSATASRCPGRPSRSGKPWSPRS